MKRIITIAALALVAGALLTGCCQKCRKSREAATRPLQGTVWHMIQFDGREINAPDSYELTFFNDGRIAGVGDCNRFFGTYEVLNANGSIKMSPVGSTMMACPDLETESAFLKMFENVHLYQFDGKNLYLFVDNKIKAIFEPTDKPVDTDKNTEK